MNPAVVLIDNGVARFDNDLARINDGVSGTDAEICQNLVDLGGVCLDRPDFIFQMITNK